jgi:hypothetical protein
MGLISGITSGGLIIGQAIYANTTLADTVGDGIRFTTTNVKVQIDVDTFD